MGVPGCLMGRTGGGEQRAVQPVGVVSRGGSRRVGGVGVVGGIESSRDRGHRRGALDRKSTTILGRGIKDLLLSPTAAASGKVQCGAERCSEVWINFQTLESCGGAVRLGSG